MRACVGRGGQRTNTRIFQQGCFPNSPTPSRPPFVRKGDSRLGASSYCFGSLLRAPAGFAVGTLHGCTPSLIFWFLAFPRRWFPFLSRRLQNLPGEADFVSSPPPPVAGFSRPEEPNCSPQQGNSLSLNSPPASQFGLPSARLTSKRKGAYGSSPLWRGFGSAPPRNTSRSPYANRASSNRGHAACSSKADLFCFRWAEPSHFAPLQPTICTNSRSTLTKRPLPSSNCLQLRLFLVQTRPA